MAVGGIVCKAYLKLEFGHSFYRWVAILLSLAICLCFPNLVFAVIIKANLWRLEPSKEVHRDSDQDSHFDGKPH